MTFIRYRLRLLLGLLAALALLAVGVASAAPGTGGAVAPVPLPTPVTSGAAATGEPLTCHLDGSRVEFTRGPGARAIAVAKGHCTDDRKAKLGIEVTLHEDDIGDESKVGPKIRKLCENTETCVAKTSAPRTRGTAYCIHAVLFYSKPSGGEVKADTIDRCDTPPSSVSERTEPARPLTGAGLVPGVGGGGGG